MEFGRPERHTVKIPEGEEALRALAEENSIQDAEIGLHEWDKEIQEKRHAEEIEQLKSVNGIDHLTGAKSRKEFDEALDRSLKVIRGEEREKRAGVEPLKEFALIMMDIDHFKNVNDTLGHHAGDMVLKKVAETLQHSVRDADMVARWGGEEFFILLRDATMHIAAQKAEEFRTKIEALKFPEHPELHVTASFGVVCSGDATDAKALEEQADKKLYTAKEGGRNRIEI